MEVVENGWLKCLMCCLNVFLFEVGIDGLFINIFSYNILDVFVLSYGSIEISSLIWVVICDCSNCSEGLMVMVYCKDCSEYLCDSCVWVY